MSKRAVVPVLAITLVACADGSGPLSAPPIDARASLQSATIWFASTPPVPAVAGGVYEVVVETTGTPILLESLTTTCGAAWMSGFGTLRTEVHLYDAGTCTLRATETDYWGEAFQSFEVVRAWSSAVIEGSDIVVQPGDHLALSPVTLTFSRVTSAGTVSVLAEAVDAATQPQPPANFQLGDPPTYHRITPGGELAFDGTVRVCIRYGPQEFSNVVESELRLLHWNGTGWDVLPNQAVDVDAMTVCADTESFSPFAIAYSAAGGADNGKGKAKAKAKGRS